jgi:hypothetical protein
MRGSRRARVRFVASDLAGVAVMTIGVAIRR